MSSLPKTVTRQRRGCDLNPGRSAPESTRLPSHPIAMVKLSLFHTVARNKVARIDRRHSNDDKWSKNSDKAASASQAKGAGLSRRRI